MTMFDKYLTGKSVHVILQNFGFYLKRAIGVSKSFERIFIKYGINLPCPFVSCIIMTSSCCFYIKNTSLMIFFLLFQFNHFTCFFFRIKIDKTVYSFLVTEVTVYIKTPCITFKWKITVQSSLQNTLLECLYKSAGTCTVSSLISSRYTTHSNEK